MQVIVKARHTRVPASLKEMAIHKLERVRRFDDRITKLEIEFSEEHNPRVSRRKHTVEVALSTKAGQVRAKASGADPAAAVDAVVDKLERQVKRLKDKMKRKPKPSRAETIRMPAASSSANGRKRAAARASLASLEEPVPPNVGATAAPAGKRRGRLRVRRTDRFPVKPMTPLDAAMELEEAGESFVPFVNAETGLVSVVYRMRDGAIGLMEPADS